DVHQTSLNGEPGMEMYQAMLQAPAFVVNFVVRARVDPLTLVEPARRSISSINAGLPISNISPLERVVYDSVAPFRFNTYLLGLFALIALVLAAVGIFGVINYSVTQRTQEIGIRMAIGASSLDVRRMIVVQGLRVSSIGLAVGLAGCFAFTRLMATLLFNTGALDPLTLGSVAAILIVVSILAAYIPARRATKVDPINALRRD
ncbi:MAG TPA: FtsX-like permease family protein, partial [Blastocatellia bacterium]|nr:FtsX-like permease family protein [Blastocatellia bacterium]